MYSVIVCPKCKKHAQIIQPATSSTRCQLCGKFLDLKHVRVFARCTTLDDAVGRCTVIKAHLYGQDEELKNAIQRGELSATSRDSSANNSTNVANNKNENNKNEHNYNAPKYGGAAFDADTLAFKHSVDKKLLKKTAARGFRKIFLQCLSNLSASDGKLKSDKDISIVRLTECLDEHGFNLNRVDEYVEKMKLEGMIYEPKNGIYRYLNE